MPARDGAGVPIRSVQGSTTDPEEAIEMASVVIATKQSIAGSVSGPTEFRLRSLAAGALSLDNTRTIMPIRSEVAAMPELLVMTGTSGQLEVDARGRCHTLRPDESMLFDSGWQVVFESVHFESVNIRLPRVTVAMVAAERTGIAPADLRFTGMRPVSPEMERYWLAMADLAQHEIDGGGATLAHPILHAATVDMFAAAALATFPNTTMTQQYVPGVGYVGSRSLRRAVAYMDAMAGEPILIRDVAQAAGTTPRALQEAFRSTFGMTPAQYLRKVRLDRAHGALLQPERVAGPAGGPPWPEPLQRAVAFMEDRADTPITVADVAAASYVSVRTLQLLFHRQLGTSPMAHLRGIRLSRAHEALVGPDPQAAATVTEIAHRWGFSSASRFAAHYRQAYGRSPSDTLSGRRRGMDPDAQ